jgi:hypothetical protein
MRRLLAFSIFFSLILGFLSFRADGPLKKSIAIRLENPATLAKVLNDPKQPDPIVLNVGTMPILIKNAVIAGPASTDDGLLNFKSQLVNYKKSQAIVIYCGCCAIEHCPNVGPALDYALDQGYTNIKVLDIQKSLKTEWQDKGYPMK